MELRLLWDILWRRRWIVLQCLAVFTLGGLVAPLLLPEVYQAKGRIHLSTADTASVLLENMGLRGTLGQQEETDVRIGLATVDPILEEVIHKLQLRTPKGELLSPNRLRSGPLSLLMGRPAVDVDTETETGLVEITATARDNEEAAMIVNTLAEVSIAENLRQRQEEFRNARQFLEERIKAVRDEYVNALVEVREFRLAQQTVDLDREKAAAVTRLSELQALRDQQRADLSEAQARLEAAYVQFSRLGAGQANPAMVTANPQIESLKRLLSELNLDRAAALIEKTAEHPDVRAIDRKIETARSDLMAELGISREMAPELQDLERSIAGLTSKLAATEKGIEVHIGGFEAFPAKEFNESQLELRYMVSQEIYGSLLQSLNQIGIAEAMTLSDIRLVEPAEIPELSAPASPSTLLFAFLGVFFGGMWGVGLAFLVDYLDDTIKDPADLRDQDLAVLGTVPFFRRKGTGLISERSPRDIVCESYRTLKTSIRLAGVDKTMRTFLVTSPMASEGKTTTVANIGIAFAREGKRVLLIDSDLRKPRLHQLFGLSHKTGLTDVLTEDRSIESAVLETEIEGIHVLPSGRSPADPGLLVESEKMKDVMRRVSEEYDVVILDSPPVLVAHDAVLLGALVDGVIFVINAGKETRHALAQEREYFRQAGLAPLGLVLNKYRRSRGAGYFSRGYYYAGRYHYGHHYGSPSDD